MALVKLGRMEEARADLGKVVPQAPAMPLWAKGDLALRLATFPDPRLPDATATVKLAGEAAGKAKNAAASIALGAAQFRAGNWQAAKQALDRAASLPSDAQAQGWFFLAMTCWQLDDRETARQWYDKAVAWMEQNAPKNGTLLRLRAEAEKVLGIGQGK